MTTNTTSSYIDLEKLTGPDFSPPAYANALVLSANNPSDPAIDLTTPLSRALFDLQEIDSNIHTLTSRSAIDILHYTSSQNASAARILSQVEAERNRLNASYARLETEVLGQFAKATDAKLHAERSHQVMKLGRGVQRALSIARHLEVLLADSGLNSAQPTISSRTSSREDHRLILQASLTVLYFRDLVNSKDMTDLAKINVVRVIRGRVFEDGEAKILDYARRIVREFAISSLTSATGSSFSEVEDSRGRFTSAVYTLYLLSPLPDIEHGRLRRRDYEPEYMLRALHSYLQSAIQSSSAGIGRGLGQLPTLDRALAEASARCQNVFALEALLGSIEPPEHPMLQDDDVGAARKLPAIDADEESGEEESETVTKVNLLDLLLESLDTSSLPSYFWRSLSSALSVRVQDILNRGGVSARTLRANKDSVRAEIRECVLRGSRMPSSVVSATTGGKGNKEQILGNWEREAAVMVGSVIGPLNR